MSRSSYLVVLLCLYNLTFLEALNDGFSLEIIHRDSSRSPFYRPTETQFQRVANAVRRSIKRTNTPNAIITPDFGEYLVSYSIGTPPFQLFGIVDTGSDIIWLQCQPCKACYKQTVPLFNPSKSKTFETLPCSKTCLSVQGASCSNKKTCEYNIGYASGAYSHGDLSVETLTLGSTSGSSIQFPKTVIGCGHNNSVSFQEKNSGIVGLGNGPVSLISQLSSSIRGKFSHCLVPMLSQSNSSSKLNFGDAAEVSGVGTVSTPLVLRQGQVFYFLTIEALSVESKRIEFKSPSSRPSVEGNIVIDSGTTLTFLPPDVYSKFESAVVQVVKLKRVQDPTKLFSLCYKATLDKLNAPKITANFKGADVGLNSINTFTQVADEVVCLAFQPTQSGAVFGNLAQQSFLIGYDLQKKTVSFKRTDCTK
ncbi:aspartic proteinase CDR1 [Cajanus cajan]|uniref:Aspartic proteinase nepenthesin-1 n=1 Tax=Cajanus cajan TaxID=3821 RepID=A0A151RE94_CAJCA|nr:aspartic proteinase CDR1 [Cajanus cajan]KYP40851.1 Aspartic proteinase nepenthesin-1 [Cajanus cajan]